MADQRQVDELFAYVEYVSPQRQIDELFAYLEYVNPERQVDELLAYVEYAFMPVGTTPYGPKVQMST
jgi:hypothetical protein